ncbi:amidohydrolase family protein [Candidatus Palauibacter sp.]|uniref:amidohydrolase family protein n=1 Tax=Candidatus Palauibacter sp. TaxID=3101350 RepID=UPI003B02CA62
MAASRDFAAHPLHTAAAVLLATLASAGPADAAMATQEILISGGTVVTSERRFDADVRVRDGTIVEIGTGLAAGAGARTIDATGLLVMPGGVDPHVHLGGRTRDDYRTGSQAALATLGAETGQTSAKIFMVWTTFDAAVPDHMATMAEAGRAGILTMVHCEDWPILAHAIAELTAAERTSLEYFPDSRPVLAEVVACQRAVAMAEATGAGIASGSVHVLATDHVAYLREEKM